MQIKYAGSDAELRDKLVPYRLTCQNVFEHSCCQTSTLEFVKIALDNSDVFHKKYRLPASISMLQSRHKSMI